GTFSGDICVTKKSIKWVELVHFLKCNQTTELSTSHKIWSLVNFVAFFIAHMDNSNQNTQIPNITLTPPGDKGDNSCRNCSKHREECVIRLRQRPGPKPKNDHDSNFQVTDGMLQNTNFQQQRNNI
ncbi:16137_t:CDS:2, partial [Acaulospora morrowiae]